LKEPTVNRIVTKARHEVGKDRFDSKLEEKFREYAERQMLTIKLQKSVNQVWRRFNAQMQQLDFLDSLDKQKQEIEASGLHFEKS
jgi:hypothetical protein